MNELLGCLNSLKGMLVEEQISNPMASATINDLMNAALISSNQNLGMVNITDTMKQELINGVDSIKVIVCTEAFNFYDTHDFEPTPEVVPIMRDIVEVAADNGLL